MAETPFPSKVDARIVRDGDTVRVEPDPIRVQSRGAIRWWSDEGSFTVVFKTDQQDRNPLDGPPVRRGQKGPNAGSGVEARIRRGANGTDTRRYAYTVAVCVDGEVYAEDPEVEVGPEGGGG